MKIDFFSILKETCANYGNILVTVTDSKYWNRQGQRWLAQHVATMIRNLGFNPIIISNNIDNWEHKKFQILEIEYALSNASIEDTLVVFSVSHHCDIAKQINKINKFATHDCTAYAIDDKKVGSDYILNEYNNINKAIGLLQDTESKGIFLALLSARIFGDISHIKQSNFPIYHHPIFNDFKSANGILIDGGAYDGNDSKDFAKFSPIGSEIHGYEFDSHNFKKFNLIDSDTGNVIFFNKGLWSKSSKAKSLGGGISAQVVELGEEVDEMGVELISLDDVYYTKKNISFIKLDVEGAEIDALKGAKSIISKNKPMLSVSVYHRPKDLWEIILLIHSLNPEYKFYLGQHDRLLTETVLYCV